MSVVHAERLGSQIRLRLADGDEMIVDDWSAAQIIAEEIGITPEQAYESLSNMPEKWER